MTERIDFTEEQRKFIYELYKECTTHEHCTQCIYFNSCIAIDCLTPNCFFETDLQANHFLNTGRRLKL